MLLFFPTVSLVPATISPHYHTTGVSPSNVVRMQRQHTPCASEGSTSSTIPPQLITTSRKTNIPYSHGRVPLAIQYSMRTNGCSTPPTMDTSCLCHVTTQPNHRHHSPTTMTPDGPTRRHRRYQSTTGWAPSWSAYPLRGCASRHIRM